ncbi:hypothetical protein BD410DRAFT_781421 [Rickenella mellea]|uniref:Metallo-beta-lactamase domain-containing protein n=1 Tax=Rickenella mellea TaxID=50990 RepID=A0A4Y7QN63_9AGAM|nr:hypothetical protein BD410DRAFT_781421 [Rickenella mellea]
MKTASASTERDRTVELIFLGTGTSSSLPQIGCLTAGPNDPPCRTCLSTLRPEGKKNIRRNTSAVFRMDDKHGRKTTIVVDVGKNFRAAALEWFPKYGLRRIDAVLITHAHADAMNGLDDLRGWTLHEAIQSHIDIYVSKATFVEVERAFPYLVSKEFASGGGDVPEFKWHIIEDKIPFELEDTGIFVTPFSVHHGRLFTVLPTPAAYLPTPNYTAPSTPISGRSTPQIPNSPDFLSVGEHTGKIRPYLCYGFKIEDAVVYLSDVSHIPDDTWSLLKTPKDDSGKQRVIPVFVVDCLRPRAHTSHFGLREAMVAVRRMGATRSYMTGFGHEVMHEEYSTILESVGTPTKNAEHLTKPSQNVVMGLELVGQGDPVWVRPAFDGLRVVISPNDVVTDNGC